MFAHCAVTPFEGPAIHFRPLLTPFLAVPAKMSMGIIKLLSSKHLRKEVRFEFLVIIMATFQTFSWSYTVRFHAHTLWPEAQDTFTIIKTPHMTHATAHGPMSIPMVASILFLVVAVVLLARAPPDFFFRPAAGTLVLSWNQSILQKKIEELADDHRVELNRVGKGNSTPCK